MNIYSGAAAPVTFRKLQRIEFGMMGYEYQVPLDSPIGSNGKPIQIQAEKGGRLYLVPPDKTMPVAPLPEQPAGFPLVPTSVVDLT
ncbi:MAG: hypothetical protein WD944_08025 [Steroidobacteraceae bacterium]